VPQKQSTSFHDTWQAFSRYSQDITENNLNIMSTLGKEMRKSSTSIRKKIYKIIICMC
jgi:hypothetical protein